MRLLILFSVLLSFSLEASSRRESRNSDEQGFAVIEFPEVQPKATLEKNALRNYRHLHRQGLKAFHQKKYQEGLQCFGLALKNNARSGDLKLDYALFSLVIPNSEGRNVTLAKNLLEQIESEQDLQDPRYFLSRAIINWLEGQDEQAKFNLSHIKSTPYEEVSRLFQLHVALKSRVINPRWAELVIPMRLSPLEKRKKRSS